MVKSYLRYVQSAGFGLISSGTSSAHALPSSSGLPLVVVGAVDALVVWNLRSGEAVTILGNESTRRAGPVTAVAASLAGDLLAAGHADGSIRLWEFDAGCKQARRAFDEEEPQPVATFNGHRSGVSSLSFAWGKPGRLVSGSNDGDVILWNVADEAGLFRLPAHNDAVTAVVTFERNGLEYTASAAKDGMLRVYDTQTQHCVQTVAGHRAEVWDLKLDPAGGMLVSGSVDAELRVYLVDREKGGRERDKGLDQENVLTFVGSVQRHRAADRVSSLAFGTHGGETFLAVAAADKSAELFRVRNRKAAEKHRVRRRKRMADVAEKDARAKAEDEGLDTGAVEESVKAARAKGEEEPQLEAKDFLVSVRQIKVKDKLRSVSFLLEKQGIPVKQKGAHSVQLLLQTKANALEVHKADVGSKTKRKRDRDDGNEDGKGDSLEKLVTLEAAGHRRDIRSVSLATDDRTLLSAGRFAMKLWNIDTQRCLRTIKFDGYALSSAFISADASRAAVGLKEGLLAVYDMGSGSLVTEVEAHDGAIWDMCLDSHIYDATCLITCGADKKICFWEFEDVLVGHTGKLNLVKTLEMPDEVLCVRVAYGAERPVLLAALMDSTVRAFYLDSLEPYLTFYGHRLPVMSMDVSRDGQILATGSADKTIKLWGMDFGDCRRSLRAHSDSVLSVAFQPKTHYIFSGSRDGSLKYWDGDKFEFVCDLEGQRGEVWSIAVSDDGALVVSASHDRMMRVWRRTDEPLFLEEEKDRRMDEMFESTLIDKDLKDASKARKPSGFMDAVGDVDAAGKRSLSTVKAGERLLEALDLCDAELVRQREDPTEHPSPLLLGLSTDAYMMRTLEQIKTSELEEALHVLPLSSAINMLGYCSRLLDPASRAATLCVELLARTAIYLLKLHNSQIVAGAASRKLVAELHERLVMRLGETRSDMGLNSAALQFWRTELAERDDMPFRDAEARAFNIQLQKKRKVLPMTKVR